MRKKIWVSIIVIMAAFVFVSCGNSDARVILENEDANQDYIQAATAAMDGAVLALQDEPDWGTSYSDIKKDVKEPYINDDGQYLTKGFYAKLPSDEGWTDSDGNIQADNFISTDILSYYVTADDIGLYEFGFLAPDPNLYQYDFLKEYYTKKYGEPDKEEWEWKNASHTDAEKEEYYQLFADGYVRVLTVWDIKELNSVLVIDWLNDPVQYSNNYGQISFYQRTDDFSVDGEDSTENSSEEGNDENE